MSKMKREKKKVKKRKDTKKKKSLFTPPRILADCCSTGFLQRYTRWKILSISPLSNDHLDLRTFFSRVFFFIYHRRGVASTSFPLRVGYRWSLAPVPETRLPPEAARGNCDERRGNIVWQLEEVFFFNFFAFLFFFFYLFYCVWECVRVCVCVRG